MLIYEYRIPMPMDLADFERAHLYATVEVSKKLTGGGEGVEILTNEPFEDSEARMDTSRFEYAFSNWPHEKGQYTHKILHAGQVLPTFMRLLAPSGSLEVGEKSFNSFPYCTTFFNNSYMKDNFYIIIETINVAGDRGDNNNIFNLSADLLSQRKVVTLDIADNRLVSTNDYNEQEDPTKYTSTKSNQGPLTVGWVESANPVMCSYKRVTIHCRWFGLQDKIERVISTYMMRALLKLHRSLFCTTDIWYDLTMPDIRSMEEKAKGELNKLKFEGGVPTGMVSE